MRQRKDPNEKLWYVYEWYIVETGQVFYVGQGVDNRYKTVKGRQNGFDEIYNSNKCEVRKVYEDLTQQESWDLEKELIEKRRSEGHPLTNNHKGGRIIGTSGKDNPAYGKVYSEDEIEARRQANLGEKNPMYGISPRERMDEETYRRWREKQKANKIGEKNPNYGKHTLRERYANNPELAKEKQARCGGVNGRAKKVTLYENGEYVNTFGCMKECAEYLIEIGSTKYTKATLIGKIAKAAKSGEVLFHVYTLKFV